MRLVSYRAWMRIWQKGQKRGDEDSTFWYCTDFWNYANVSHTLKEVNKINKYSRTFKSEYQWKQMNVTIHQSGSVREDLTQVTFKFIFELSRQAKDKNTFNQILNFRSSLVAEW